MNLGKNKNKINAFLNQKKSKVIMTEPLFKQIRRLNSQNVPVTKIINVTSLGNFAF